MPSQRESAIRERAYAIWEQEGRTDGKDVDYWLQAETEHSLLAMYAGFQRERHSSGEIYPFVHYDKFLDRGRYHAIAMPVIWIAQGHILETENALNRFCYDLHSITAWNKTLKSATEAEKRLVLYEFVIPTASLSLSAPYSIKQKFMNSICHIHSKPIAFVFRSGSKNGSQNG